MNTSSYMNRHQRIDELEWVICRREDDRELWDNIIELQVLWIPEDMFDNIFYFDELYSRFSEHSDTEIRLIFMTWVNVHLKTSHDNSISIPRMVLANIEKTRNSERVLLMGDMESDNAYKILEDLQKAIWNNPSALVGHDEDTQSMGKEWASNFVESMKDVFRDRGWVVDNNEFWADCIESIPLQEQYKLLDRIYWSKDLQDQIFQRICAILPSCPWHEFDWWDIKSIVSEIENTNLANEP